MADSEKITVNMWPVDLGQIDLLVEQGYYSNRTDFIRISIKNQLQSHQIEIKQFTAEKYLCMGVLEFDKAHLEKLIASGKQVDIKLVGALIVADDVTLELAQSSFSKVKLFGMLKASPPVKAYLQTLNR